VALTRLLLLCSLFLVAVGPIIAQAPNVLTWRYDNTHQGQNTQETILTPANVNTNMFGKLFSHTVEGQVYAQPLYVANLTLPNNTTHNVIFIADEHDSVYAFDADSNGGADSGPLWQASMISTAHGAASGATPVPTSDIESKTGGVYPEIGITSTPVIDINTGTLFVVAKSKENGNYVQRLHALNILTGNEQPGSPVAISASVPGTGTASSGGTLSFSALWELNRPALGLFNGNIYIAFGSLGDNGPWHGWVLVYNETTLNQTAAICTSPNGTGNAVWMSGEGLPIDTISANGRAFLATGNGDLTTYPPLTSNVDYGESVLRYDLSNGGFTLTDAFTPFNQAALTTADLDQGSGGVLILPDQPGAHPHLLIQIGKEGRILVLDRDNLGGYVGPNAGSNTNAVQDITGVLKSDNGLWSTPAYWNGNVYMWAQDDSLKMIPISNGVLGSKATAHSSATSTFPGASPVVSSNGTQNGIVWALQTDLFKSNGSAVLYAFNAQNVAHELYASNQNSTRDDPGAAVKFTVPVITNGKVYVGANGQVDVYGLLNGDQQVPAPVIFPSGGTFSAAQQITLTDTVSGAAVYYTTDGSTPAAGSTKYTSPFQLSTDATVQAIASASGFLQSPVASAAYTFSTQTAMPHFSPAGGSFSTAQQVTLSDGTAGAVIYYTMDGSTPTTSSTVYSSPISVDSGSVTIEALAQAPGLSASSVASATYAIQPAATAMPTFSPGTGTYTSTQSVTMSDATAGATIYFTTDGSTPTTSSAVYNSSITISTNTTLEALAVAPGFAQSAVASAAYVIQTGGSGVINFAGGFPNATGLQLNGVTKISSGHFLELTDGGQSEAGSAFWTTPVNIQAFTTNFTFQLSSAVADGFTFTIQNTGVTALGSGGGGLGYGPNTKTAAPGIGKSVAIKFDIYSNSGEGNDSTGVFTNGATPTIPAVDITSSGIVLSSGDTISAQLVYDGTTLTLNLTDTVTNKTYSHAFTIDIPSTVGADTAYVGFTGGTGGSTAIQNIKTWTFTSSATPVAAEPVFSPIPGTYTATQDVSLSSATSGATIYYTVDGSTPSHSSAIYSAPIVVSGPSLTIRAFASATGDQDSPIVAGAYVIQAVASPAATPTFGPASGTSFSSTLSVSIADTTSGASIYYTTDGSAPTTSSQLYSVPFTISATTTVNAIATASGFTQSAQGSASYTYSPASGAPVSDEFNETSLNTAVWQVTAPVGGSATLSNGELVLTVPGGSNHDAFLPALDAVQVIQSISNANFDVAVKVDSTLTAANKYYGQGLLVEGDAKDHVRFEVSAGGTIKLSANTIIAGAQTTKLQISPFSSYSVPTYLRLTRVGTTYTAYWSKDGSTWNQVGTFTDSMVVTGLAPYAWNYSTTPSAAPALTATFDWFHNLAP
jgi:Legume lectin domain/Chitobiase/beta-hexosaminidase C-terminal domain